MHLAAVYPGAVAEARRHELATAAAAERERHPYTPHDLELERVGPAR